MKRNLVAMVLMLCACGCLSEIRTANNAGAKLAPPLVIVADSVEKAEPIIAAIEDATGARLSDDTISAGERGATVVEKVARTGAGIAAILGSGGIAGALGALGTLAGAVGALMQRRRARSAEAVRDAVIIGADNLPKAGVAIRDAAIEAGVADDVEAAYRTLNMARRVGE